MKKLGTLLRIAPLAAAAALLAPAMVAAPASAATTCNGVAITLPAGGPGNETINGTNGDDVIAAGGGVDLIRGNGGSDLICGEAGGDTIVGGPGNDTAFAGDGDDFFVTDQAGLDGADAYFGGNGVDLMAYELRLPGVGVTFDDLANDGVPGEGDNVRSDVERLRVPAGDLDLTRFEELVEAAGRTRGQSPERAGAQLAEALSLWRGPALDGLGDHAAAHDHLGRAQGTGLGGRA